ncbi:MAG: hypothetical protein J5U17_02470 [Candidatus Methanoperedens sp.]|nr:hypothetical protein [Candidatus Methanoperedens sp.]MCE8424623.1 hypothetical protein [Candidatus Methanoperedens sp.]MCE8428241.1 hypothetical protein [Candidatus Methanoperedens sp.]
MPEAITSKDHKERSSGSEVSKKKLACPCGKDIMRLYLTASGSLEIECDECGSVMIVGAGICPSRLEIYSIHPE